MQSEIHSLYNDTGKFNEKIVNQKHIISISTSVAHFETPSFISPLKLPYEVVKPQTYNQNFKETKPFSPTHRCMSNVRAKAAKALQKLQFGSSFRNFTYIYNNLIYKVYKVYKNNNLI